MVHDADWEKWYWQERSVRPEDRKREPLPPGKAFWQFKEEYDKCFSSLKQGLTTSPVLTYPRTDKDFILDTDASNEGIGAGLSQKIGNEECVIAYFSKSLDNVLYRKWESDGVTSYRWQLILPKSRIPEVLRETHDSPSRGHFGVMKTMSKTRERFYWDRLSADVEKWCRECHACGPRKGPKTRTKGRLQLYNVGAPFERIALDILGPFPVTTKGNKSAEHEATRLTPAEMLFGRTLRLPCDILFGRPNETPSSPNEYMKNLEARLESIHAFARERNKLASERMKTLYDSRATNHQFKEEYS
ncbi:Gypsy retrotransposon integrase-like protein 1 [Argiope bruennichi]|uniref:RNA-directed DNA polymerase n=1 Tax=Argiope bruennichi TaxID=94029 RepID=A0A8T0FME8_ARGBR|nr:Gypsy retrotransposon integrase-like protein 1 [Argiope bruennichi]